MTSTIEKRQNLHIELAEQKAINDKLNKELDCAAPLAGVGAAMAMIAHEINNLLTPLGSYAALALKHSDDQQLAQKVLRRTSENCKQAAKVVEAILGVANGRKQQTEPVKLHTLIDEVFLCICRDFSRDRIQVKIDIPDGLTVKVTPAKLQQVLMNLILNARDAMLAGGGTLTIKARQNEQIVTISVQDSGSGIETEHIKMIFEPFFTTKDGRGDGKIKSGSGLGLYLCRRVIDEYGGTISVESEPGDGSTFTITLPGYKSQTERRSV